MSVRIAYDDPADAMDPAMDGHAEQLRRIDAEDARRHQAREAEHTPPHSDGSRPPDAEGPSSAGGRPLQTPSAPDTPTPPRARGGVVADPLALLAEVERERELRTGWYERCREAEAERNVQRMRAEKAEAALDQIKDACRESADHDVLASQVTGVIARHYYFTGGAT